MDAPYSPLEFALLNDFQRDFPLVAEPFAELARRLDCTPEAVLATAEKLQRRGAISRVGAVFAPWRIGVSTLAAIAAPPDRLEEVAALVSSRGRRSTTTTSASTTSTSGLSPRPPTRPH